MAYLIRLFCCSSLSITDLEDELQETIAKNWKQVDKVYFNKGL